MRRISCLLGTLLAAAPLAAQGGGMGGFTPPPDHWMTIDSLTTALTLSSAEVTAIKPAYDSINVIMKQAKTVRDSMRAQFQSMQGMSMDERRAKMAPVRERLDGWQTQVDALVGTIKGKLTADQQTKLAALPQPHVAMRRPPGA